jgi:hypothetical protein
MLEVLIEAGWDTLKMIPILAVMYVLIELVETRFSDVFLRWLGNRRARAPVVGALLGTIPQCGFTVISAGLYRRRAITVGTLLAVFIATSDEAIPVMAAHPDRIGLIGLVIAVKIALAVVTAYAVDAVTALAARTRRKGAPAGAEAAVSDRNGEAAHRHAGPCHDEHCGASCGCGGRHRPVAVEIALHVLKTSLFVFLVTAAGGLLIRSLGDSAAQRWFLQDSILQPAAAALVGLIPNCAASVAITSLYLKGLIGFGSLIAGLSSAGGVGLIVLFREHRPMRANLAIVATLFAISALAGILIRAFAP